MQFLIVCYLLFVVPFLIRSIFLLGAGTYRAGQTNSAPPKLFELPAMPRFKVGTGRNARPDRDESDRLPDV